MVWDQTFATLQSTGIGLQQAAGSLARQIQVQAYTQAALDLFWAAGWLSLVMVPDLADAALNERRRDRGGGLISRPAPSVADNPC